MRAFSFVTAIFVTALTITSGNSWAQSSGQTNKSDTGVANPLRPLPKQDSLIVISAGGDTTVTYLPQKFDFGELPVQKSALRELKFSTEGTIETDSAKPLRQSLKTVQGSRSVNTSYSVGQIPYEEGLSPSGARTYIVPIATAADLAQTPSISLQYNSQAENGVAGYGWSIGGLSSITQTNKNIYYHGTSDAASYSDPVFSLDGIPLVQNTSVLSDTYPLITTRGNILARVINSSGYAKQFEVLYPNGTRAQYGVATTSSTAVLSFPVTRIEDVQGNFMTFSYTDWNGIYHITDIQYGGDFSRSPMALIHFQYFDRIDYVNRYSLGKEYSERKLLKSITSSDGGEELRTYSLSHTFNDGVYMLNEISCKVGASTLSPLSFSYNNEEFVPNDFEIVDSLFLSRAFTESGYDFVYRRGKMVPDSYGDGIIIYPSFSTYDQLERKWVPFDYRYRYGSRYHPEQEILIFPYNRSFFSQARSILAGEGFQTVEAVDVDGDGVDEIVKVNHNGTGNNRTDLLITIYEYDSVTNNFTPRSFSTYVSGNVTNPQFTSPSQLTYFFGDYVGDGKTKLLVYSYDKNVFGKSQISEGTLIDLESGAVLKRQTLFSLSIADAKNIISLDIDADSRTEFCHFTSSGLSVYSYRGTGSGFSLDGSYTGITSSDISSNTGDTYITDLNADGLIDIVSKTSSSNLWTIKSFTGTQFVSNTFNVPQYSGDKFMFIDVNRDNLPDLVVARMNYLRVYLNEKGIINSTSNGSYPISDTNGIIPCNIINYDGMSSFIKIDGFLVNCYSFKRNLQERRLLTTFYDSFGTCFENEYKEMPSLTTLLGYHVPEVYDIDESLPANSIGFSRVTMPIYLLYRETAEIGRSGSEQIIKSNYFRYFNATVNTQGLGFCGFRMIRVTDAIGNSSQWRMNTTYFDPEKFGCIIKNEQGLRNQSSVSVKEFSYDNNFTTYGKLNPRLTRTTETDYLTGVINTTSITYSSYDLPTAVQISHRIGSGVAQTETINRTFQNSISTTKYVLGTVTTEMVTREADGLSAESWKSRIVTTYDGSFRPLTKKSYVGLSGTNLVSEQRWQYDSHSNVTSERKAAYGATTFNEITYTYDASGRHVTSSTDALGRTTTFIGYDKYGNPSQTTDWLGRSTTYSFDVWGNMTQSTLPDGTEQSMTMSWSVIGDPGVVCVTNTTTGSPDTRVWNDALGREIRSAIKRFDGSWQYSDSEYDTRGRLLRTSIPYKGSSPSLWNTYTYDEYDRTIRLDEASGKTTTWEYIGTSTTTTSEGVSSTSTANASGNVVSVIDPGGSITYALRDDAQPSSVTVTPAGSTNGVVTSFSYDAFGRRTSMVDQSVGTRTTSYTDGADGTSSVSSSGPNGTVTISYDRFGRTTGVTRPEFNTTYTYGASSSNSSYGKLLSEASTNGTGRNLTYDNFGRILTDTEQADSAHWFRKTYSYGSGSAVASISYATQDGDITTESFEYTHGHVSAVTIPEGGGSTIWRITEENALGQPTSITTGSTQRTYLFTSTGIPQRRTVCSSTNGIVQDISYSYDTASGNMLWRQDNAIGYREVFTYDEHNRFSSSRQTFTIEIRPELDYSHVNMQYSSNGNVVYRDNDGILDLFLDYNDTTDPYLVTGNHMNGGLPAYVPEYGHIGMTSFDRPVGIGIPDGDESTLFTYNASGDRTKMTRNENQYGINMDRYYLGGIYERDIWNDENGTDAERLFLGGNSYDAPMVLVKAQTVNGGAWTPFNILRDVQGSVTEVTSADGEEVVESFRYDPWGLRIMMGNVTDILDGGFLADDIVENGQEGQFVMDNAAVALTAWQMSGQSLYVGGHGYTGHEHIPGWGLINMNARLYDPALCRFLSPDPVLQDPANTQNYNRYSYCLNNPLRYTDESGKFIISGTVAIVCTVIAVSVGAGVGVYEGHKIAERNHWEGSDRTWAMIGGGLIGGAAGFVSSLAGAAVGVEMTAAGTGGFIAGAATGGAAGAAGGLFHGFGMTVLETGNPLLGALQGIYQAGAAGLSGALLGGVIQGTLSSIQGKPFWDGGSGSAKVVSYEDVQAKLPPYEDVQAKLPPYEKGQQGVIMAKDQIIQQGGTIQGTEATIEVNGIKVRVDLVAEIDGKMTLIEVKNGLHAGFTRNQTIVYPKLLLEKPLVTPVGSNAKAIFRTPTNDYNFIIIKFNF